LTGGTKARLVLVAQLVEWELGRLFGGLIVVVEIGAHRVRHLEVAPSFEGLPQLLDVSRIHQLQRVALGILPLGAGIQPYARRDQRQRCERQHPAVMLHTKRSEASGARFRGGLVQTHAASAVTAIALASRLTSLSSFPDSQTATHASMTPAMPSQSQ